MNPAATAGKEGRKDGDGETAPRATSQALGMGHWARLNCWPGLLRETKGGEDTKKLRGRQQEQEECLSLSLSSLLVKQQRGSLSSNGGAWGQLRAVETLNHHLGDETVSKARRGISLARRGLACLRADGPLDTSADALGPGSRG